MHKVGTYVRTPEHRRKMSEIQLGDGVLFKGICYSCDRPYQVRKETRVADQSCGAFTSGGCKKLVCAHCPSCDTIYDVRDMVKRKAGIRYYDLYCPICGYLLVTNVSKYFFRKVDRIPGKPIHHGKYLSKERKKKKDGGD